MYITQEQYEKFKEDLIAKAHETHGKEIYPLKNTHLKDGFKRHNDFIYFWYNTPDNSSHIQKLNIVEELQKAGF